MVVVAPPILHNGFPGEGKLHGQPSGGVASQSFVSVLEAPPFLLFALASGAAEGDALDQMPDCMLDSWSSSFVSHHRSQPGGLHSHLCNIDLLHTAEAMMFETTSIEAGHASVRRVQKNAAPRLTTSISQTLRPSGCFVVCVCSVRRCGSGPPEETPTTRLRRLRSRTARPSAAVEDHVARLSASVCWARLAEAISGPSRRSTAA